MLGSRDSGQICETVIASLSQHWFGGFYNQCSHLYEAWRNPEPHFATGLERLMLVQSLLTVKWSRAIQYEGEMREREINQVRNLTSFFLWNISLNSANLAYTIMRFALSSGVL